LGLILKSHCQREMGQTVAQFKSTFTNKVDKKGRVSVPASFRASLPEATSEGIVIYPSFVNDAIEGCDKAYHDRLSQSIDAMPPFSEEKDAFTFSVISSCASLNFDSEGRIIIPPELIEFARITDRACFVGKGGTFQIWSPEAYQEELQRARTIAKQNRSMLTWTAQPGTAPNGGNGQ